MSAFRKRVVPRKKTQARNVSHKSTANLEYLLFRLRVRDGWPPVAVEGLWSKKRPSGREVATVPLLVKGLSIGDVIIPKFNRKQQVVSWKMTLRSGNSTIWLMRLAPERSIARALARLRKLGCETASLNSIGRHAISVPAHIPFSKVDQVLASFDENQVGVAFPSFRHSEAAQ